MSDRINKEFYSERTSAYAENIISLTEEKNVTKKSIKDYKKELKELKQEAKNLQTQILKTSGLISTQKGKVRKINFKIFNTKRLNSKLTREFVKGKETNLLKYTK